jgi:RecB family exonuclease
LWDPQTARLVAIDHRECRTEQDIFLLGAVDMNVALRRMLDQVADHVTALIFAPQDWADRFDEHGCLVPALWSNAEIPLTTEQIAVVEGPNEQATEVLSAIANYNGRFRADDITIGVPDEELTPDIARVLSAAGLATRWGPGESILRTGPCLLLTALADYLRRNHFRDFATLVRHPDVEAWVSQRVTGNRWLLELDNYHMEHLPARLTGDWLGDVNDTRELRRAFDALSELTRSLAGEPRDVSLWSDPVLNVLSTVYGDRVFSRDDLGDRATLAAGQAIRVALDGFTDLPPKLAPQLTAAQTIRWVLEQLAGTQLPPPPNPDAIEMLGWLELPLDDAPALIVTNLNEGFVPDSINSDLFLPNRLREQLGLMDNARRYARDAYALSVLIKSRSELRVIVGRRNHDGDPLIPSRLLFATDRDTAVQRALRFFRPQAVASAATASGPTPVTTLSGFEIPRPQPLARPIEQLSVTSFRDYIACPYRFYLRRVLKLESIHDHSDELDGGAFGELAHEVLRQFGNSPTRDSTDTDEIAQTLDQALNDVAAKWYGPDALAVVHVQVEQLRLRLHSFAQQQAEWAAQGWRIERTELVCSGEHAAAFPVDDEPFYLTGRIDRIDVHVESGRRMIFDYKTSDTSSTPHEAHQRQDEWCDLQLPLYRHLAAAHGFKGPMELGYILLPKDASRVVFCSADWTAGELAAADERARAIIRAVREEVFWPPVQPPPDFSEDFAAICQDTVFGAAG